MSFTTPIIPSALRIRKQWLVWRLEQFPDEPKPRKVPYYVNGAKRHGDQGTAKDLSQLATFEQAVAAVGSGGYTGIGLAILDGTGLVALDFDHCVADGQILDPRIAALVEGTYAEFSPSGTGLRAFFTGTLRSRKDNAHRSKRVGGEPGGRRLDGLFDVEVFGSTGFVTVTGNATSDVRLWGLEDTVAPLSPTVLALYRERFKDDGQRAAMPAVTGDGEANLFALASPKLGWTIEQAREYLFDCSASVSREEWLNALMALHHEFDGSDDALDLADEWSATGDTYAGRQDVEGRWHSFGRHGGGDAITGRWLLAWRRTQVAARQDDLMREALQRMQTMVSTAEDMLTLQTKVLPQVSDLLLEFPVLEIEAYSIVAAQAKKFGTPINKTEFKKLLRTERPPAAAATAPLTEFGNTERMLAKYGENLMFVPDLGAWFVWTGVYWRQALGGRTEIMHYAKETIKELPKEAGQHPDPGEFYAFCSASQRAQMVSAMVTLAESDHRVVVPSHELDKHSHYLGVKNGVVDLRTGALLPPDPDLRITLVAGCEYNPGAKCPLFERTLREVFFDDAEMVDYVLRAFGYALLGDPKEDIMFIAFGNGANGKSTVFNAVREAFGRYARAAEAATFVSNERTANAGGAREDLVRLRGARFVYVNEPDENGEMREGAVKSMTGGDAITARGLWATASVELTPTWTVFMPTNHKPIIRGSDNGIWRRMGMLPFERNFEADPTVPKDKKRREKLRAELPGILALLVRYALRYQQEGLTPPAKVQAARETYRNQMDLLSEWIDECCVIVPGAETRMTDLWDSWSVFANRRGDLRYIRSATALGRRLDPRFPGFKGTGGARFRIGIALKNTENLF